MEKNYEQYAAQVKTCIQLYEDALKKRQEELNRVMTDARYSEQGRQEKLQAKLAEVQADADNMTKVLQEAVKRFCDDFRVVLPEDGADHSRDIENALRIIDILGYKLDVQNLKNILNPIRGSYRTMKTIIDVLQAKNINSDAVMGGAVGYDPAVMEMLYQYSGFASSVSDYVSLFGNIEEIIDSPVWKFGYEVARYSNTPIVEFSARTPYSFLACPGWMIEIGQMYAALELKIADTFTKHVPTDKELIEQQLNG